MWISKKKYNELQERKDNFASIADRAVEQNGRILNSWRQNLDELVEVQKLNKLLQQRNEELLARCKEQEERIAAFAEGKAISREAE